MTPDERAEITKLIGVYADETRSQIQLLAEGMDARFENVQMFDRRGRLLMAFGEEGTGPGQFSLPVGVCADREGRIWVADSSNRRLQVFRALSAQEGGTAQ